MNLSRKGNWILSTPVLKKGDVLKVSTEDIVGNISEPYIIKVGETPSVVKPDSNNKEEQKVDNEQGTNKETGEKSESKKKEKRKLNLLRKKEYQVLILVKMKQVKRLI
ncbi:MAG: hypothetical protein ACLT8H_09440 [Streptococcus parasanguinis]